MSLKAAKRQPQCFFLTLSLSLSLSAISLHNSKGEEMGTQTPAGSNRTRTNWTPAMECYFIDLLLDQVHRGNRMGHTLKKQAWTDMLTVQCHFGSPYDKKVLKSHYTNLWTQFNELVRMDFHGMILNKWWLPVIMFGMLISRLTQRHNSIKTKP